MAFIYKDIKKNILFIQHNTRRYNMKELLYINTSFENLYEILIASIRLKLMLAGIELGAFNHLPKPESADAVADAIESHQENTRLFLDDLAACDLLLEKDGKYRNTTIAQEFLVEGARCTSESCSHPRHRFCYMLVSMICQSWSGKVIRTSFFAISGNVGVVLGERMHKS